MQVSPSDCTLLADKGYIDAGKQFYSVNIRLETPMRANQGNDAKIFIGLKTRILSKITALTIVQYINWFINNRPINFLKHAI